MFSKMSKWPGAGSSVQLDKTSAHCFHTPVVTTIHMALKSQGLIERHTHFMTFNDMPTTYFIFLILKCTHEQTHRLFWRKTNSMFFLNKNRSVCLFVCCFFSKSTKHFIGLDHYKVPSHKYRNTLNRRNSYEFWCVVLCLCAGVIYATAMWYHYHLSHGYEKFC